MRHMDCGRQTALRAKLLLGVAGAAAAMSSAAFADSAPMAPPSDPDKYAPYSDIDGRIGTNGQSAGKIDIFAPVWQDLDSLIFVNLGTGVQKNIDVLYNAGLGYRTKIDEDWILGVYAGYDGTELQDNNSFGQATLGAELMSADWDLRLNGYIADSQRKAVQGQYGLYIAGSEIAVVQAEDVGYSGLDGEVGYRIYNTDRTDVRLFVGGFSFMHDSADSTSLGRTFDFNYKTLLGLKARAEATVYDLDVLGSQSRLTFEAEVANDDVRKTTGYIGATLRIPLGDIGIGSGGQALDELDRRMVDPVRNSGEVVTRSQYTKPEPVIIYGAHMTSQPTNTLLYVDNTLGAGSYANPTTLHDATTRATTNAFIVLTSKQGAINTTASGDGVMQSGQTIVGGGETFTVEGVNSHEKFTHDFAPGTVNPTITTTSYDNPITLASTTNLYGFSITGDFDHAVYGHNVTGVNIRNLTIDGTGGGTYGIDIYRDTSGTENLNISNVNVSNVRYDGIQIESIINDGGTSTENISLDHITINNVTDGDGIFILDYAGHGSKITSNIAISDVSVTNAYYRGINVVASAYGAGSSVNQTANISDATVTYAGNGGIILYAESFDGAAATQTGSVTNSAISYVGYNATHGYGLGIGTFAAGIGSVTTQNVTVTDVNVSNVYGSTGGYAFAIGARARAGGAIVQTVTIDPSSGTHSGTGLEVYSSAFDYGYAPTTIDQSVTVTGGSFSYNYNAGVGVHAKAGQYSVATSSESAIYQNVSITNATIDYNGTGINMIGFAVAGSSITQNLTLSGVQIDHNTGDGIYVGGIAATLGFLSQNVTLNGSPSSYNDVSYNGGNGIEMDSDAFLGGQINQHLYAYYTTINHNGGDGIHVQNYAGGYLFQKGTLYYSHLQQNVKFYFGSANYNTGNGVSISNTAYYGAQIDQFVSLYRVSLNRNGKSGFYETSQALSYKPGSGYAFTIPTNIHSDVYIYDVTAAYNARDGIAIYSDLRSPTYAAGLSGYTYLEQHITLSHVDAYGNGADGFLNVVQDTGVFGIALNYVTLSSSDFGYNKGNGATFVATQFYGPGSFGAAVQDVTITNSSFYKNGGNGLYAYAFAEGNQGRAEQHFTVTDSYFGYNVGNGISLNRVAESGVYKTGLPCYVVQGLNGGCAFVRETFDMTGGSAYANGGNGLYVRTYAADYAAVYAESGRPAHTATIYLNGVGLHNNGGSGFYATSYVRDNSFAYQYVIAESTRFNHNGADGFRSVTYSGDFSTVVERNLMFGYAGSGITFGYNATGRGFAVKDYASGESRLYSTNILLGVSAYGSEGDGIKLLALSPDLTSRLDQHNYVYNSYSGSNKKDGIGLIASGSADQYTFLGNPVYSAPGNFLVNNGRFGLYGHAYAGGYQKIEYQLAGNTFSGNGVAPTDFNSLGGFQNIY